MKRLSIKPSWVILILLIILLQYQLWFQPSGVLKLMSLKHEVDIGEAQNSQLRERNKILKKHVARLKNDPHALEGKAREDLGMVKEGETYYRVVKRSK